MSSMQTIIPPFLQKGDKVAVIAPAGKLNDGQIDKGLEILKSWGLEIVLEKSVFGADGYFAGTDEQRLFDLQSTLDNPEIKAIICARGGYGTTRVIDSANFTHFQQSPKWIIGFSDITAFHSHIHQQFHVATIHAPTLSAFGNVQNDEKLYQFLFGLGNDSVKFPTHDCNRVGEAEGILVGGNLSLLVNLIGTKSDIDTSGKILFIEEVGEPLYHFDRMLTHLLRTGKLDNLAGLLIGGLTDMTNPNDKFNRTAEQIVSEKVAQFAYPLAFSFPAGHQNENQPLIFGQECLLNVETNQSQLSPIFSEIG